MPGTVFDHRLHVLAGHVVGRAGVVGADDACRRCTASRSCWGRGWRWSSRRICLPVIPTVTTRMMDAEPMTMPSMVSRKRALLARKLSIASETISLKIMVLPALASVLSKVFFSTAGLGTLVVAISGSIRRLPVWQRCRHSAAWSAMETGLLHRRLHSGSGSGIAPFGLTGRVSDSHWPDLPERKMASMTAMFRIASSMGTGTSVSSSMALEKASPCSVYWSQDRECLGGDAAAEEVAAGVDEEPRRPVGRRVHRNLQLDAPLRAEEMEALVRHQLRAAGEDGLARGEVEDRRGEPVGVHLRVAVDEGNHARRLLREGEPRRLDEVAANVHQRAAADVHLVADVRRIDVEVAEEAEDRAQLPDAALVQQLPQPQPLRMAAHHEGLADLHAGARAHRQQRLRLGDGQADRLLAQHVLARLRGLDRPRHMQVVGQRIVDGVDVRVGEQLFVRAVGRGNAERGRLLLRLRKIARGDGNDCGKFAPAACRGSPS